jgi:hypothetical protein
MTTITDPAAEVDAWNTAHKPGTLVQWRSTADADFTNTGTTWIAAYLLKGIPTVRVTAGDFVPLSDVRIHPAARRLAGLDKVKVEELEFPPPSCGFCNVDTNSDGDGFTCPQCQAWWSSNGTGGQRQCVECCADSADVVGEDGQPRCLPCAADVVTGVLEATVPYRCRHCRDEVTGIGLQHGKVYDGQLCGGCNHAKDRGADLDRWRAERTAAVEVAR